MFSTRYLLLAAAMIGVATAMPRFLKLSEMINNTVCAMKEEINEDPDRIPQRIKMIKCEQKTDQHCVENKIPHHECCHHTRNKHMMECVEMTDAVAVFDKKTKTTKTINVSVGCACMISRSSSAGSVPGPT